MTLNVRLLGRVQLDIDGRTITMRGHKPLALLAYLLVTGQPATRRRMIDLLFDGPDDPHANLRWTLAELRHAIGADFLAATRQEIAFNFACGHTLDVAALLGGDTGAYGGEFLAGLNVRGAPNFEAWVLSERERLDTFWRRALAAELVEHETSGNYTAAIGIARRLLAADNLEEQWHRALMRLLAQAGQREAALAQFDWCCRLLQSELDVPPSAETVALAQAIRQRTLAAAAASTSPTPSAPAAASSSVNPPGDVPHNLPLPPTPFVGRTLELAEIARRLASPDCRLLTLVGPGGIGKSRLALETAARLVQAGQFPGGIYFVAMAEIGSVDLLASTLAELLKLPLPAGEDPLSQLLAGLRRSAQPILLVLDDCHDGEVVAALAPILQAAPALKLIATARDRLNLRLEWVQDVRGLAYPGADDAQGDSDSGAVQLFAQCAARMDAAFALSPDNKPDVVRICQLVEGMPLALELAAGWIRVLSSREIAGEIAGETSAEVAKSLDFLASSERDMPPRHRSIRAVFDHSWAYLVPEEQQVFRRLAVFHSGFRREAAAQVASASLPILSSLAGKGLIRRSPSGRYDLHPLLRQYGGEHMQAAGENDAIRSRHLEYYVSLLEMVVPQLQGAGQTSALALLDAESDNFRAAMAWSLAGGDVGGGLRLAAQLGYYWYLHDHQIREGCAWLERLLALLTGNDNLAARERAWRWLGYFNYVQGKWAMAHTACTQALALGQQLGDQETIAESLYLLGHTGYSAGDLAAGRAYHERARSAHLAYLTPERRVIEPWLAARALNALGEMARIADDYSSAREFYAESMAIRRVLNDARGIATCQLNLGYVEQHDGNLQRALEYYRATLVQCHTWGWAGAFDALAAVGGIAIAEQRFAQGAWFLGAAEADRHKHGVAIEYGDRIEVDRSLAALRAGLDPDDLEAAWRQGAKATMDEAVAAALADEFIPAA